jgi:hypothetical protein
MRELRHLRQDVADLRRDLEARDQRPDAQRSNQGPVERR